MIDGELVEAWLQVMFWAVVWIVIFRFVTRLATRGWF